MVQFKDIFLGKKKKLYGKVVTCQKCVRAGGKHNDLENVGINSRHHTFFEMLGNFSFGDYFKEEAILYAWEFLISEIKLQPDLLHITVYKDDAEAKNIWLKKVGINKKNLTEKDEKDNFWSMGNTGPCGPCSEIFYDRGKSFEKTDERFIEIWNLVFMQFNRIQDGSLIKLDMPCIDTGMGLERISSILGGMKSNYDISIFKKLSHKIIEIVFSENNIHRKNEKSFNVITDHIRSSVFLISDGIVPGNEGRNYVLRKIIRRAMLHGKKIGLNKPFFYKLVDIVVAEMSGAYTELAKRSEDIKRTIKGEEDKFFSNLNRGLKLIREELKKTKNNILSGKQIFNLYDTYGFPIDFSIDIAKEEGYL